MQFNGVKQSKIRWTVVEIKFMKGKNFNEKTGKNQKIGLKNLERYIKIEKKICNFWCKAIKNPMDSCRDKIHGR